ncbi:hypothetical protein NHQ30_011370 [Ciborinia camelliae]|nr:hypothetical protein NHQ30_011370 [Ciborinia camelliae]
MANKRNSLPSTYIETIKSQDSEWITICFMTSKVEATTDAEDTTATVTNIEDFQLKASTKGSDTTESPAQSSVLNGIMDTPGNSTQGFTIPWKSIECCYYLAIAFGYWIDIPQPDPLGKFPMNRPHRNTLNKWLCDLKMLCLTDGLENRDEQLVDTTTQIQEYLITNCNRPNTFFKLFDIKNADTTQPHWRANRNGERCFKQSSTMRPQDHLAAFRLTIASNWIPNAWVEPTGAVDCSNRGNFALGIEERKK